MRVLHISKTSDGAQWAARQARVLSGLGVEVHVALPSLAGMAVDEWRAAGATIHVADLSLPARSPHHLLRSCKLARSLVAKVKPDLIHSHFVTTTCLLRLALGKTHAIPRIYQVAGPLHLEHWWSRRFELSLAGPADVWVGSSRCITEWYRLSGVPANKVFLSYYGFQTRQAAPMGSGAVRRAVNARPGDIVVGNVSWMYAPKPLLGQRVGLKCHEDIITALAEVTRRRPDVLGVFVGGAWNNALWYERKIKRLATSLAGDRIRFAGTLPQEVARYAWADFDLAVHVPLSENCGGVVEPLNAGVPVIASAVGGLPEVILHERTGWLVPPRQPRVLAQAILQALEHRNEGLRMARLGKRLVGTMFDVERTAREVHAIYLHLLDPAGSAPAPFHSDQFLSPCSAEQATEASPQTACLPAAVSIAGAACGEQSLRRWCAIPYLPFVSQR